MFTSRLTMLHLLPIFNRAILFALLCHKERTWAVLKILTYYVYAPVFPRCPCSLFIDKNGLQQLRLLR